MSDTERPADVSESSNDPPNTCEDVSLVTISSESRVAGHTLANDGTNKETKDDKAEKPEHAQQAKAEQWKCTQSLTVEKREEKAQKNPALVEVAGEPRKLVTNTAPAEVGPPVEVSNIVVISPSFTETEVAHIKPEERATKEPVSWVTFRDTSGNDWNDETLKQYKSTISGTVHGHLR